MGTIHLLSTDFDGTLIGGPADGRCVPALAERLAAHKALGGIWAINTGRSLDHIIEGVERFRSPVEPDFLLTNEREVFRRTPGGGWEDFGDWNAVCRARHDVLFEPASAIFSAIRSALARADGLTLIEEGGRLAGLVARDEAAMDRAVGRLGAVRRDFADFSFQRNTVYLRFCHTDYDKGAALRELARLVGVGPDETFAAGDHHNDLPMLDGASARHVACPANAIPEVRASVEAAGGHVASVAFGEGTAEALERIGV